MKKLTKSNDKKIAGVIGGIAEYYDMDPTLLRVIFVFLLIFTCGVPAILFYILAAAIMPSANATSANSNNQQHANHSNTSNQQSEQYTHNQHTMNTQSHVHDVTSSEEPKNPHE